MASASTKNQEIIVDGTSSVRTLVLNRPQQLNALSYQMISNLLEKFVSYEDDPSVKLVILKGQGRAFCSGGDLLSVAQIGTTEGRWDVCSKYFRVEYTLNYIMATNETPQVSILNGIIMGGGTGISIHGRFRIATEKTYFAMPETTRGIFPVVGASYFLSKLPGFFGEYIGLTGPRLDGAEMLACGLATHFVPSKALPSLEKELSKVDTLDPSVICAMIDWFAQKVPLMDNSAYHRLDVINRCFSRRTIEEILSALENEAEHGADAWLSKAIKSLNSASPISLKICLRSIREGRVQGLDKCLIREYRMSCHALLEKFSQDFYEGARAIMLDKDKSPKWKPSKLELVSEEMVDHYFSKVDKEGWRDLELSPRKNSIYNLAKTRL
ncbi:3-hydroxyisobutyryl-CoA hydrolase 1 isoform X2 [Amborella trichopoda]|uniref:3-hydroxyisobutyryl-CoA hydrolase 1 isoform X2 n=1 Tax=Amborella trichopoda TaxID=13333 RepID=UPI0005D2DBA2|nr:3-hydroxyisobutyryl-CoA hydrolase 1 isoform X2 [Amborella trichopoda]|eukprot:XP_011624577.1 3-hydroxyisobutyryl-CoA hydrolase 1 isoform X2 [Amborella trichopoda]